MEVVTNQLYSQMMRTYQQWFEAQEVFAASPGCKCNPEIGMATNYLNLADMTLGELLDSKYSPGRDLRTTDDYQLHDSGRRIENAREGVLFQIMKTAACALNIYLNVFNDAQINIDEASLSHRSTDLGVMQNPRLDFEPPQGSPHDYYLLEKRCYPASAIGSIPRRNP